MAVAVGGIVGILLGITSMLEVGVLEVGGWVCMGVRGIGLVLMKWFRLRYIGRWKMVHGRHLMIVGGD